MSRRPQSATPLSCGPAHFAHRLFCCTRCRRLVNICPACDHGNQYCSQSCAAAARRDSLRRAGQRYQQSAQGQLHHRERQQRYRQKKREPISPSFDESTVPNVIPSQEKLPQRSAESSIEQPPLSRGEKCCEICGISRSLFFCRSTFRRSHQREVTRWAIRGRRPDD